MTKLNKTERAVFNKLKAKMKQDDAKKVRPFDRLNEFMTGKGIKHIKNTKGTYTRKRDGKVLNVIKAHFDNGKTYVITENNFWKER